NNFRKRIFFLGASLPNFRRTSFFSSGTPKIDSQKFRSDLYRGHVNRARASSERAGNFALVICLNSASRFSCWKNFAVSGSAVLEPCPRLVERKRTRGSSAPTQEPTTSFGETAINHPSAFDCVVPVFP